MKPFKFKHFTIHQEHTALKVGTDAMLLGAIANHECPTRCLDIGAGTGVIALMLAQKFRDATIVAIEPDAASLLDCQTNIQESEWSNRISSFQTSIQGFHSDHTFDLIVTNPPFYEKALLSDKNEANQAKHAPNGLLEDFFRSSMQLLSPKGLFWIILPIENKEKWIDFANEIGMSLHVDWSIESKPTIFKRCILAFGLSSPNRLVSKSLLVRNASNDYSNEYKELTKEFHFNKL